jgi:hypothetical protein
MFYGEDKDQAGSVIRQSKNRALYRLIFNVQAGHCDFVKVPYYGETTATSHKYLIVSAFFHFILNRIASFSAVALR